VETWVQTLEQDEVELGEPSLEIARQVKEQDVVDPVWIIPENETSTPG
jgi:hypothetical protein